jgi:hypothetical protein
MAQAFHTTVAVLTKEDAASGPARRKIVPPPVCRSRARKSHRSSTVTVLSIRNIYEAALSAAFSPHQAVTWTSIALAESGGNTNALNNHGGYSVCKN